MSKNQLELLVQYQDLQLMLQEVKTDNLEDMGFDVTGTAKLKEAIVEMESLIKPRYLRAYQRLTTRHHRPIAPVSKDVCLGCFAKQPTSYKARAWDDKEIFTCEQCGRILYWIQ